MRIENPQNAKQEGQLLTTLSQPHSVFPVFLRVHFLFALSGPDTDISRALEHFIYILHFSSFTGGRGVQTELEAEAEQICTTKKGQKLIICKSDEVTYWCSS